MPDTSTGRGPDKGGWCSAECGRIWSSETDHPIERWDRDVGSCGSRSGSWRVGRRCPVVRRRGRVSGAASELIGEPCGGAGPDQHLQIDGVGAQCECALSSGELPDIPPGDSRCWGDGRLPASCRVGHPARLSRIDKWGSRPTLRGTGATNRDLSDSFDGVSAEVALNQLHACGVCGAGPIGLLLRP